MHTPRSSLREPALALPLPPPLLLLLLLLLPNALAACSSNLDCSLNGLCVASACACDASWTGAACDTLALLPSAPGDGTCDPTTLNGTARNHTTTWGGHPVADAAGRWHVHVAEMALHCGMCSWSSQSQVAHYSSPSMLGPYARVDTAVGAFAHNPAVVVVPDGGNNVSFLMAHIGIGCDSTGAHVCNYDNMPFCTNGSTPVHPGHSPTHIPAPPDVARASMHVAASLDGPWTAPPPGWTVPTCNNPSPLFLANGSLMLMCHGSYSQCNASSGGLSFFTSLTANWRTGPYGFRCLRILNPTYEYNGTLFRPANEDPHLFADSRGALHVITHNQSPCYSGPVAAAFYGADVRGCGGHFFSADGGESWTFAWRAAYNGTVIYDDGTSRTFKRERPKVVQDGSGRIIALATGIGPSLVDAFAPPNDTACTLVSGVRL